MYSNHYVAYMNSPIDYIEIQANEDKIISLEFVEEKRFTENTNKIIEETKRQLQDYFEGKRKNFNLPVQIMGTPFQEKVWQELIKIPYGKVLSYGDVAKNIDNKKASRAVGNANNKNKISIIIPCHRVIGANGKLVGYGGGLWRKEWLLHHEGKYGL